VGKGGWRPGERKWKREEGDQEKGSEKGETETRRKEVGKMRQRPGGKEVGKTESGRQLSVSLPCLKCGGGVGHRGKREEKETRRKGSGKGETETRRKGSGKGKRDTMQ
jgi:hypothetical protein